ncbi:hypothetical protein BDV98DRAFT_576107 [Pterulicium gracile]|uniref:Uncharacterized protein n=1 Tax=Pterulicium gracile TaxID=1884261 RepID=A0A5C3Q5M4_9AGAR|nr:hypothetical protein BDV98DRAFT_576107 [Pterula gracilis]
MNTTPQEMTIGILHLNLKKPQRMTDSELEGFVIIGNDINKLIPIPPDAVRSFQHVCITALTQSLRIVFLSWSQEMKDDLLYSYGDFTTGIIQWAFHRTRRSACWSSRRRRVSASARSRRARFLECCTRPHLRITISQRARHASTRCSRLSRHSSSAS